MRLQLPQRLARIGRHASTALTGALWGVGFYLAIKTILAGWFGRVFWGIFGVWFGGWFWREVKEAARKRQFEEHLNPEQLSTVVTLRRIVSDIEAHAPSGPKWKIYFTQQYWTRTKLPPKPSPEEVETALKVCEDAIGPYDVNMHKALNDLMSAARTQKVTHLERVALARYIPFIEHKQGKEDWRLVSLRARLGQLYFTNSQIELSASTLSSALTLHNSQARTNPQYKPLITPTYLLWVKKMLGIAHSLAKDYDAAEKLLAELLPVLEQEEGVLNAEPVGTQAVRGMLIDVYIKQGYHALTNPSDDSSSSIVTRYLRDAMTLIVIHPSFYAHNLKQVGRLFVWAGNVADGTIAFRLSNTVYLAGLRSGTPQRNCLCPEGKEEVHGLRTCDACSKKIYLGDRWLFCRTCVDIDLCGECYAGAGRSEDRGWEDVDKFPRKCLGHEFFEVDPDEREDGVLVQVWMADVTRRLAVEVGRGSRISEATLRTLR